MRLKKQIKDKMEQKIAVIRIAGKVNLSKKVKETLERLGLRAKYSCLIFSEKEKEIFDMVINVKDRVAFGNASEQILEKLEEQRGKSKKINKSKSMIIYRLHPARGGLKSTKLHYPKGVLGNHKEDINKLIERML
jgi:large subunit ribosomal protein L30